MQINKRVERLERDQPQANQQSAIVVRFVSPSGFVSGGSLALFPGQNTPQISQAADESSDEFEERVSSIQKARP
jgi:hypothetical protein